MSRNLLLITEDNDILDHVIAFIPPTHGLAAMPTVATARAFLLHADEPDPEDEPPRLGQWVVAYGSDVVEDYHHGLIPDYPLDPAWGSVVIISPVPVTFGIFQAGKSFPGVPLIALPGDAGWRDLLHELAKPPAVACDLTLSWPR